MKEPKEVRPTSSKVLQALFNILGPLHHRSFLDLFAGTGRVSAEAWQRGARPVAAVELLRQRGEAWRSTNHAREHTAPRNSFEACGPDEKRPSPRHQQEEGVEIFWGDVRRALRQFHRQGRSFDIVFADPPYHAGWVQELLKLLVQEELPLTTEGIFVLEHTVREPITPPGPPWQSSTRTYGETALSFFQKLSLAPGEKTFPPSAGCDGEEGCP